VDTELAHHDVGGPASVIELAGVGIAPTAIVLAAVHLVCASAREAPR
jgi:hypothetical protein